MAQLPKHVDLGGRNLGLFSKEVSKEDSEDKFEEDLEDEINMDHDRHTGLLIIGQLLNSNGEAKDKFDDDSEDISEDMGKILILQDQYLGKIVQ